MRGRKGFIGDSALGVATLMIVAIFFIIGMRVFTDINDNLQGSEALGNESKATIQSLNDRYNQTFDNIFLLVFGLFAIALVLSTAMIGTRPEFFFITIIVGIFIIGGAAAISNSFGEIAADDGLSAAVNEFTILPLIMNNLVEITLVLIGLLLFGLYVKARGLV